MNAYKNTSVSSSKSQEAIRKILIKSGVKGVQFSENFDENKITIKFAKEINGNFRTVSVSMIVPKPPESKRKRQVRYTRGRMVYGKLPQEKQEQMNRATYRALHYWLKSQFEAVEFGLLTFEDVFLSHFEWMMADGTKGTLGKLLQSQLNLPALESGVGKETDVIDGQLV